MSKIIKAQYLISVQSILMPLKLFYEITYQTDLDCNLKKELFKMVDSSFK